MMVSSLSKDGISPLLLADGNNGIKGMNAIKKNDLNYWIDFQLWTMLCLMKFLKANLQRT